MQDLFRTRSLNVLIEQVTGELLAGCSVLTIRGCTGSGKTHLARYLAFLLKARGYLVIGASGAAHTATEIQDLIEEAQFSPRTERLVLLVDDAEACPIDLFNCLWTLVQRRPSAPVFQLVLFGDVGPWPGLDAPGLEDLRRDSASCYILGPLEEHEAAAYVRHRLGEAAWKRRGYRGRAALRSAAVQSSCVPVVLNQLVDDALAADAPASREEKQLLLAASPPKLMLACKAGDREWKLPRRTALGVAATLVMGAMLAASTVAPPRANPIPPQMPSAIQLVSSMRLEPAETVGYEALAQPLPETIPGTWPSVHKAAGPGLVIVASAGDDMQGLYDKVYRGVEPPSFQAVLAVNRAPVKAGALVVFPEPPHGWAVR